MQLRCCLPTEHLLADGSVPRQDFEGKENLAARRMDRKRRKQPSKGMRQAGMITEHADIRLLASHQDLPRERDQARGGAVRIGLEIGQRPHRLVVEVEPARLDESL
jgi:hypothetical protein